LSGSVFNGAGVKTVVLFFEKGMPTKKFGFISLIWLETWEKQIH
jgi:hypothetical protein